MRSLIFLSLLAVSKLHATEISVMTYNVENLFDTYDDPLYNDEEFLPDGHAEWTDEKLDWKLRNLAKVILSVENTDGSNCPDILGLQEVENRYVIEQFAKYYVPKCGYKHIIIHEQDPREPIINDRRGIKNALVSKYPLGRLFMENDPYYDKGYYFHHIYEGGRYIVEVKVEIAGNPLTIFVNHWKSRGGGGEDKRNLAANVLNARLEEINRQDPFADILAIGDFNDEPEDESLDVSVGLVDFPREMFEDLFATDLYDTSFDKFHIPSLIDYAKHLISVGDSRHSVEQVEDEIRKRRSTYYYHRGDEYLQLDHILLSRGLFHNSGFQYKEKSFEIIRHPEFKTAEDIPIPFRSRRGGAVGGASDHFPIVIRLQTDQPASLGIDPY